MRIRETVCIADPDRPGDCRVIDRAEFDPARDSPWPDPPATPVPPPRPKKKDRRS